jgi:hypothetical protein
MQQIFLEAIGDKNEIKTHHCNPRSLGGRYREDHGLMPSGAKSSQYPISSNGWMSWQAPVIPATQGSTNGRN